jgi:hypothetical protein
MTGSFAHFYSDHQMTRSQKGETTEETFWDWWRACKKGALQIIAEFCWISGGWLQVRISQRAVKFRVLFL